MTARYPLSVQVVLGVYVAAFLTGTATHVSMIVRGIWLPDHPFLNVYWTALAFLDPLTVVLLLTALRVGLALALAIMVSDVAINSAGEYLYVDAPGRYAVSYFVQLQTAFLGFLLGSLPFVWTHAGAKAKAAAD